MIQQLKSLFRRKVKFANAETRIKQNYYRRYEKNGKLRSR